MGGGREEGREGEQACEDELALLGWTVVQEEEEGTYVALIPLGQVELVGEEVAHSSLLHFFLQDLQEVSEPLEGVRFPAEPIEIDLRPGNRCRGGGGVKQRSSDR